MVIFTIITNPESKKEGINTFRKKEDAEKFVQELKKKGTQYKYYITKYID